MNYFILFVCSIFSISNIGYTSNINSFYASATQLKTLDSLTLKESVKKLGEDADAVIAAVDALKKQLETDFSKISDAEIDLLLVNIDGYLKYANDLKATQATALKAQNLDNQLFDAIIAFEFSIIDINSIRKKLAIKRRVSPEILNAQFNELIAKGDSLLKKTVYDEQGFNTLMSEITVWRANNSASIENAGLEDLFDTQITNFETAIYNKKNHIVTDVLGSKPFTYEMTFILRQTYKKEVQTIFDYTIVFTFDKKVVNNEEFWAVTGAKFVGSQENLISAAGLGKFSISVENRPIDLSSSMSSRLQIGINLKRNNENNAAAECNQDMFIYISINKINNKHIVTVDVPDESICNACGYKKSVTYSCYNIAAEKDKAKQTLEDFFNKN